MSDLLRLRVVQQTAPKTLGEFTNLFPITTDLRQRAARSLSLAWPHFTGLVGDTPIESDHDDASSTNGERSERN